MPKEIKAAPIVPTHANEQRLAQAGEAAKELNALQLATTDNAKAVAVQLGYEGSLSVGALEDEIRFYQRRTVEACLELGKRLLLLKELTPRGEFQQRISMLGFEYRNAARFMQAAIKTSQSANLSLLSGHVKSMSAFLELVTHDEDVIENLAEIDDIERMSASEVRALARNLKDELDMRVKMVADKDAEIGALKVKTKRAPALTPEQATAYRALPLYEMVAKGHNLAQQLNKEIASLLDEQDPLLKYEAEHALALIAQYILRVGNENYIPLDHEAIGIDTAEFEAKAFGYAPVESANAAI